MSERFEQASLDGLDLDEQLADLPLRRPEAGRGRGPTNDEGRPETRNLDLFGDEEPPVGGDEASGSGVDLADREEDPADGDADESIGPRSESATPGERLLGGLADLTVHVGVLAAGLLTMSWLSLPPALSQWPGFLSFLLSFSFLYHVVPLAFWGQTPGMAWRGLRARDLGGAALSFGQSGGRWIGAVLTAALVGLPLLLAAGESGALSDRLSRSRTLARRD